MARILRYTIAGALGAIIAWAIMEPTALMPESRTPGLVINIPYSYLFVIGLVAGLLIGLVLGIAEAIGGLSPKDGVRSVLMGALFGAAGGVLGLTFGNAVYTSLERLAGGRPSVQTLPADLPPEARLVSESRPGLLSFLLLLIGRGFGWALIGGFIGLSQGVATSSTRKMVNGAVGGVIGGGIGGCVFEILVWMNQGGVSNFPPFMIRLISFSMTGGAIGLFIGFLEEVTKRAWLIRLVGRNEGKEYTIYKPITVIGRDEYADIAIFSDPDVSERHARILAQGQRHFIEDIGSFFGTLVNGRKITREPLRDGDTIEIGKTKFLFHDKASARFIQRESYATGTRIPSSEHVCPFCGAVKDASGKCECTVAAASPAASEPTAAHQAAQPLHQGPFAQPAPEPPVQQTAAMAPGPRLVGIAGPYAGKTFALRAGETHIGREATKDIGLPTDNTVSRSHALIALEAGCYVVRDLGSTNGTYVNGARITTHELKPGDVVQVGSTKFRFEW